MLRASRIAAALALSLASSCGGDSTGVLVAVKQDPVTSISVTPAQHALTTGATVALSATLRSSAGVVLTLSKTGRPGSDASP